MLLEGSVVGTQRGGSLMGRGGLIREVTLEQSLEGRTGVCARLARGRGAFWAEEMVLARNGGVLVCCVHGRGSSLLRLEPRK